MNLTKNEIIKYLILKYNLYNSAEKIYDNICNLLKDVLRPNHSIEFHPTEYEMLVQDKRDTEFAKNLLLKGVEIMEFAAEALKKADCPFKVWVKAETDNWFL